MHWKNITKIVSTKKLKYKVSKNKHKTDEGKNNQIQSQNKIRLIIITKISKYKKNWTAILWRSTKHMGITKCKKLNMTENKKNMLNTKTDNDRAQNRHEHY